MGVEGWKGMRSLERRCFFKMEGKGEFSWSVRLRGAYVRDLSSTRAIMSRRSSKVEPMTLPPAAMFSSKGVTVFVAAWARLRAEAMRARASGRGWLFVVPGLDRMNVRSGQGKDRKGCS